MKENKCNGCLLSPAGSHGSIAGSRAIRQWEDKKRETENGRCWFSYIDSHQRVSRSWGNVIAGFWSRGTRSQCILELSMPHFLHAALKIRHTPILCHIPAAFVFNFFFHGFPDFLPSFMSTQTFMKSNTQTYAHFSLILLYLLLPSCYTAEETFTAVLRCHC